MPTPTLAVAVDFADCAVRKGEGGHKLSEHRTITKAINEAGAAKRNVVYA